MGTGNVIAMMRRRNAQLEKDEQKAFVRWTGLQHFDHVSEDGLVTRLCLRDLLDISMNGNYLRGDSAGKRAGAWKELIALGATKGSTDLTVFYPVEPHNGLRIEMKKQRRDFGSPAAARRAVREGQDELIGLMRRVGYCAVVCYGWVEAARAVCDYFGWDAGAKGVR